MITLASRPPSPLPREFHMIFFLTSFESREPHNVIFAALMFSLQWPYNERIMPRLRGWLLIFLGAIGAIILVPNIIIF